MGLPELSWCLKLPGLDRGNGELGTGYAALPTRRLAKARHRASLHPGEPVRLVTHPGTTGYAEVDRPLAAVSITSSGAGLPVHISKDLAA